MVMYICTIIAGSIDSSAIWACTVPNLVAFSTAFHIGSSHTEEVLPPLRTPRQQPAAKMLGESTKSLASEFSENYNTYLPT